MTKGTVDAAQELLNQLRAYKYSKLDDLWVQLLDDPPADSAFYKEIGERLNKARRENKLAELMGLALMQWNEKNKARDGLKVFQLVIPYLKAPKELHEALLASLRQAYGDRTNFERFLTASGLLHDTEIIPNYMRLKVLLACDEGQVFQNATRGVGVVTSLDEHEQAVEIDFYDGKPARFSFDGVKQFLRAVHEKHFLARKVREPEKMKEFAEKDPTGFAKVVLKDLGGSLRQSDLKKALTTNFFTEKDWNRWWGKNRLPLRLDPYIEFRGAANVQIILRKEPRSFYEEAIDALDQSDSWVERYEIYKQLEKAKVTEPVSDSVAERLKAIYDRQAAELAPAQYGARLEAAYQGQKLQHFLAGKATLAKVESPKKVLTDAPDRQIAIQDMKNFDHQIQAFDDLIEVAEDWPDIYSSAFIEAPLRLAQHLLKQLRQKGENIAATEAIEALFAKPSLNPEVLVWTCKQILEEKWDRTGIEMPPLYLLICLLDFMEELGKAISMDESGDTTKKNAYAKIRQILMADGHEHICRIIREVSSEEAQRFLSSIREHKALSDMQKLSIETALRNIRSDFGSRDDNGHAEHFTTQESLRRITEEYQQIKSVEIPANSHAIGEAASLGDLKENADYHAAKDHQKMLFKRVEELHDLLGRARPFNIEGIAVDKVSPGTRIKIRNVTAGADETYTLLGMWDAMPERRILFYNSPFAIQFLGHAPGDDFEISLPNGDKVHYTVLTIENALKSVGSSEARD